MFLPMLVLVLSFERLTSTIRVCENTGFLLEAFSNDLDIYHVTLTSNVKKYVSMEFNTQKKPHKVVLCYIVTGLGSF